VTAILMHILHGTHARCAQGLRSPHASTHALHMSRRRSIATELHDASVLDLVSHPVKTKGAGSEGVLMLHVCKPMPLITCTSSILHRPKLHKALETKLLYFMWQYKGVIWHISVFAPVWLLLSPLCSASACVAGSALFPACASRFPASFLPPSFVSPLCLFITHTHLSQPDMSGCSAQVVESLPADQAMEVIRSAPGDFKHKLTHLPDSLRALAALAQCPGLATACKLPGECPASAHTLPQIEFCFDLGCSSHGSSTAAPVAGPGTATASDTHMQVDDCSNNQHYITNNTAPGSIDIRGDSSKGGELNQLGTAAKAIWVCADEVSENNVEHGLYTLQPRAGTTVVCRFVARTFLLQDVTIELPQGACIVFWGGGSAGTLTMKRVKFQGTPRCHLHRLHCGTLIVP
jgi:hypothetical protein